MVTEVIATMKPAPAIARVRDGVGGNLAERERGDRCRERAHAGRRRALAADELADALYEERGDDSSGAERADHEAHEAVAAAELVRPSAASGC